MKRIHYVAAILLGLAAPLRAAGYTKNVAIVLYNGVEVLDFAGPAEVFAAAAQFGANGQERALNVYTVSKTRAPIVRAAAERDFRRTARVSSRGSRPRLQSDSQ